MNQNNEDLVVLWSTADREVSLKMVFLYIFNARKYEWWKNITLIIWGPSANLLSQDFELQERLQEIKEKGVKLEACLVCTDMYGVTKRLEDFGVDVKKMGIPLTEYIKKGKNILTF